MKIVTIAALVAAQLAAAAAPAQAAGEVREETAAKGGEFAGARVAEDVERSLAKAPAPDSLLAAAGSQTAEDGQEEEPRKKRKSTGDKVLTGAAVVLGIGALAVGGLLVAIFVN